MTLSFSVIVPVYNCQDTVVRTLQSIEQSIQYFCQTSPIGAEVTAEVVLVNDASSDRTLEFATQWMQTNPQRFIVVNHQTSLGLAAARNTGFKYAKGELIFFCDPNSFFALPHVSACLLCLHQPNQLPSQQLGDVALDVKLIQENQYQIVVPPYALDAVQTGIRSRRASAIAEYPLNDPSLSNFCVKRECHEFLEGFLELQPLQEDSQAISAYHSWLQQFFLVGKLAVETVESAEPVSSSPGMIELVQTGANAVAIPKSVAVESSNAQAIAGHSQRLIQKVTVFNKQEQARLFKIYRTYVSTISLEDHAVSWEAARYLFQAVQEAKPKRILDLGSGYSSLIFRTYQAKFAPEATVVSVDDDAEWLGKTKAFLQANDLSIDHCITWEAFLNAYAAQSYDFILYDMGNMYTRAENLTKIVDVMEPTGSLIIDDVHFSFYAMVVFEVIGSYRLRLQSLKRETLDKYGRYAVKATHI